MRINLWTRKAEYICDIIHTSMSARVLELSELAGIVQSGSNMTGTDLYVNKPHCAAAVRP